MLGVTRDNETETPNENLRKWQHPPYEMRFHVYMYSVSCRGGGGGISKYGSEESCCARYRIVKGRR